MPWADTQFYWNLTPHIFRYNHEGIHSSGLHTVDERTWLFPKFKDEVHTGTGILVEDFIEMIRFFFTLILNADENRL